MRKTVLLAIVIALMANCYAFSSEEKKFEFKDWNDSLAYVIGYQLGKSMVKDSLFLDLDILKTGMYDQIYNNSSILTPEEIKEIFAKLNAVLKEKAEQQQAEEQKLKMAERIMQSEKNLQIANEFLEKNKTAEGIKTTESGLQYKILKQGEGKSPADTNTVSVHYKGMHLNGDTFDSSIDRGEPFETGLKAVIRGWTEGLQLMKEGGKFIFYIPPDLGYGEKGAGELIQPNELLIFEVELIEVKD